MQIPPHSKTNIAFLNWTVQILKRVGVWGQSCFLDGSGSGSDSTALAAGGFKYKCFQHSLTVHQWLKNAYGNNPIIQNTLWVWSRVLSILKAPKIYLDTSVCSNHAFRPGLGDPVFTTRREKVIIFLRDFYINDNLVSFQQRQQTFQLLTSHFFLFFTIATLFKGSCPIKCYLPDYKI